MDNEFKTDCMKEVSQVFLNGERLPIKGFMEYVDMYLPDKSVPRIHERVNDRWEVVVAATSGQFQQAISLPKHCPMSSYSM